MERFSAITTILLCLIASVHNWPHHSKYASKYQSNLDDKLDLEVKNKSGLALSRSDKVISRRPYEFENDVLSTNTNNHGLRNGLRNDYYRWPNGVVPYIIDPRFAEDTKERIRRAMDHYHHLTCVKFVERTGQSDYVYIYSNETGCSSHVGRIGGRQFLSLEVPGCDVEYVILHELMHAVGFEHEHVRSDRDNYVQIMEENIDKTNFNDNFRKMAEENMNDFGVGYDYNSIMHYSAYAFSTNSEPTIVAVNVRTPKFYL